MFSRAARRARRAVREGRRPEPGQRDLYCHECKETVPALPENDETGTYTCPDCWSEILCDNCGEPWTEGHPSHD